MVGQNVIKSGTLDIKPPANSFLPRGFRFQPWKSSLVELVVTDGVSPELRLYSPKDNSLKDVFTLEDINDVTMCGSKTHAHAFEVISGNKPLIIMSGNTELDSRDWIWTLRKLFWPDVLVEPDEGPKKLQLLPNKDTDRLRLSPGVYDVNVSVTCISLQLLYKCSSEDNRQTPVEPFDGQESMDTMSIALTTVGQLRIEMERKTACLVIETTAECEHGPTTLVFKQTEDTNCDIQTIMDIIKSAIFRATSNLHDCISSSRWRLP